jgi:hypothetical protein
MAADELLRRRYRWLLWAYPGWYRRERGEEILTTLLDAAQPGQHHPSGREALDVVTGGAQCRLRIPRGVGYRAATLIVVLFATLAGWATAGALAVGMLSPPPDEQRAIAVAELAIGQPPRNVPGPTFHCADYCINTWRPGGDGVMVFDNPTHRNGGVDHTTVVYWDRDLANPTTIDQARQRLAAGGWSIAEQPYPPGALSSGAFGPPVQGFTAYRGNLAVHVHRYADAGMPPLSLTLEPSRPPETLAPVATAGAASGLIAGWLTISWLLQRYRRHTAPVRRAIVLFNLPTLVVMVILQLLTGYLAALVATGSAYLPTSPILLPTAAMNLLAFFWIPQATAIVVGVGIAVAALPTTATPTRPDTSQLTHPARP